MLLMRWSTMILHKEREIRPSTNSRKTHANRFRRVHFWGRLLFDVAPKRASNTHLSSRSGDRGHKLAVTDAHKHSFRTPANASPKWVSLPTRRVHFWLPWMCSTATLSCPTCCPYNKPEIVESDLLASRSVAPISALAASTMVDLYGQHNYVVWVSLSC